jgi:hypothetical protein
LRKQLESLFSRKLLEPHFDLYSRGKLVSMAVLELIHSNNDSIKSDGLNGASWGQEEDHIYSCSNKIPLRRYVAVYIIQFIFQPYKKFPLFYTFD